MKPKSRILIISLLACLSTLVFGLLSSHADQAALNLGTPAVWNNGTVGLNIDAPKNHNTVITENGLHNLTFETNLAKLVVILPDDTRAGDTISGTLAIDGKGKNEKEQIENLGKLKDLKVTFGASNPADVGYLRFVVTPRVQNFSFDLPDTFNYQISVNAPSTASSTGTIKINDPSWFIGGRGSSQFDFPEWGQTGRYLELLGPFDGDFRNTRLQFGPEGSTTQDFEKPPENLAGGFGLIRPFAESPRKMVFETPNNVTGPIALSLNEGNTRIIRIYRNVGVNLSAPKTNLLRGETTTLTTTVVGLQGIQDPVPLYLTASGVITMEGGMFQALHIQPSEVGADGRYTTKRQITGLQAGGWGATSTVVTTPFDIVLRDPDPPQTLLFNSFTGDYVFCGVGGKLAGTGNVVRKGCEITLTHDAPDRRVSGRLDGCPQIDNGRYFVFYGPGTQVDFNVTVTDTQTGKRNIYFNPLGNPAPAIQDVSAFATCP